MVPAPGLTDAWVREMDGREFVRISGVFRSAVERGKADPAAAAEANLEACFELVASTYCDADGTLRLSGADEAAALPFAVCELLAEAASKVNGLMDGSDTLEVAPGK